MIEILANEGYWDLVTNIPHIAFELTWELITGVVIYPFIRLAIRKHDERYHGKRKPLA